MDNIITHLARVTVVTKHSTKTNNDYTVLELTWIMPNDKSYKQTVFLNDETKALIEQSKSLSESSAI